MPHRLESPQPHFSQGSVAFSRAVPKNPFPHFSPFHQKKGRASPKHRPPSPPPGPSDFPGPARVTLPRGTVHRRSPRPLFACPPSSSILPTDARYRLYFPLHVARNLKLHPRSADPLHLALLVAAPVASATKTPSSSGSRHLLSSPSPPEQACLSHSPVAFCVPGKP